LQRKYPKVREYPRKLVFPVCHIFGTSGRGENILAVIHDYMKNSVFITFVLYEFHYLIHAVL
jgi:hypothetical protein